MAAGLLEVNCTFQVKLAPVLTLSEFLSIYRVQGKNSFYLDDAKFLTVRPDKSSGSSGRGKHTALSPPSARHTEDTSWVDELCQHWK